jgi:ribosomal protein S27AE
MSQANKMICPDCGVEMNHHADKIDYTVALEEPSLVDPFFGGVLEEAHTCPECGTTELRKVV